MNILEKDRSIRDLDRSKQKLGDELDCVEHIIN